MAFPAQCTALQALSAKHPRAHKKLIESAANGPAVVAHLKRHISGLVEVKPMGDKVARANACSPEVEAGNVYLPDPSLPGSEWVSDFIVELANFPNAAHDDSVDAFSQGMCELMSRGPSFMPLAGHGSGSIF
jgi:predicted phage terminase large subunit-like protein